MAEAGIWEREGRSPVLASILGTTLIAAAYSLAGNVVVLAYMLGDLSRLSRSSWSEVSSGIMGRYRAPILIFTAVFEFLFFGLGTSLIFRRWHGTSLRERFRLKLPSPSAIPAAIVGAAGLFPLAVLAGELFERAFPFIRRLEKPSESLLSATSAGEWFILVMAICVTPALCEEFLFRGYFQGTICTGMRSPWSWILTGSCFALVHQNYIGLGALLIIGIYLAFAFDSSGSIFPGMCVHLLYNGTIVLLANAVIKPGWAFDGSGLIKPRVVLLSLPLAALGIGYLALLKRKLHAGRPGPGPLP